MRLFLNSTTILAACFCMSISNGLNAKIVWNKDLVSDANTNSAPLASSLNKDGNGVIVMTLECPKGYFPTAGDCVLWEVGADGSATRISPKNTEGETIQTNANPVGPGCAIASDSFGNLLTAGISSGQKAERKLAMISKDEKTGTIMSSRDNIESHSIKKMLSLPDNMFALVGDRNGDGLCMLIDNQGKIMKEKPFDMDQREILTDVDRMESNNRNLAVVGISFNISTKIPAESSAKNLVLICDSNLNIIHEDYFTEVIPGLLFPKVCCLDNGNMVVVYIKESTGSKTRSWARCYTKELILLWEKEIFVADKFLFSFDVTLSVSGGFVVGTVEEECLGVYFLDKDGTRVDYAQYKSTQGGTFGVAGFNLMRVNGRTIIVFKEGSAGNIKECTIKTKVIALD